MPGAPPIPPDAIYPTLPKLFSDSLKRAPGLVSAMYGAAFDDAATIPSTSIPDGAAILEAGLSLLMSDLPTFKQFTQGGAYSGSIDTYQIRPNQGNYLTTAGTTYVVSEVLLQNQFSATMVTPTLREPFQSGRTCTPAGDVCHDGKDTFYWSANTLRQYHVKFTGSAMGALNKNPFALLSWIEDHSNANMPALFDGAFNCILVGKAGGPVVNFDKNGKMDLSCLSAIPIYLSKGTPCPTEAVLVGGKCPFGFAA